MSRSIEVGKTWTVYEKERHSRGKLFAVVLELVHEEKVLHQNYWRPLSGMQSNPVAFSRYTILKDIHSRSELLAPTEVM